MASEQTIVQCFGLILANGIQAPGSWSNDAARRSVVDLWAMGFSGTSDAALQAAVAAWLFSGPKFWPTPGAIVAHLPRGPALLDADSAYGHMIRLVRAHGSYQTPGVGWDLHDDPAQRAALQYGLEAIGGWQALCLSEEGDRAIAASFRRAYDAALQRTAPAIDVAGALEARRGLRLLGGS